MVLKDDYSKSLIEHSDSMNSKNNRKRLRSNHQNKNGSGNPGNQTDKEDQPFYT